MTKKKNINATTQTKKILDKDIKEFSYDVQGHKFIQKELTIAKDIAVVKLFKGALVGGTEATLLDALSDMKVVNEFFKIILIGDHDAVDFSKMPNSTLWEVVENFFFLNRGMVQKFIMLGMFLKNLDTSQAEEMMKNAKM